MEAGDVRVRGVPDLRAAGGAQPHAAGPANCPQAHAGSQQARRRPRRRQEAEPRRDQAPQARQELRRPRRHGPQARPHRTTAHQRDPGLCADEEPGSAGEGAAVEVPLLHLQGQAGARQVPPLRRLERPPPRRPRGGADAVVGAHRSLAGFGAADEAILPPGGAEVCSGAAVEGRRRRDPFVPPPARAGSALRQRSGDAAHELPHQPLQQKHRAGRVLLLVHQGRARQARQQAQDIRQVPPQAHARHHRRRGGQGAAAAGQAWAGAGAAAVEAAEAAAATAAQQAAQD
mmetsp:Transcript_19367/g.74375  ORF Transcript_19367/g.74375 Transcript_19367/m.74375 type:complete len:288 (-) Transcript_19367:1025-1888(-)